MHHDPSDPGLLFPIWIIPKEQLFLDLEFLKFFLLFTMQIALHTVLYYKTCRLAVFACIFESKMCKQIDVNIFGHV